MSAITITITDTRALTVEGRLVAGETAEVTIGGATPSALYLVAPDQTVVAACEAFTPTGQIGGVGFLQLATEQVAALFAQTPAGRMVAVWALVNNADGVAGAGWIPVVSAPMPDELVNLDIDFYLRASQVGAGLAIVDGKLVCTVAPPPVTSVNSKTGAVVLTGADILTYTYIGGVPIDNALIDLQTNKADAADLRYALGEIQYIDAPSTDPQTGVTYGEVALADRTANAVSITTAIDELRLVFPVAASGHVRDFELCVDISLSVAAAPALAIISPSGENIVAENADGALPQLVAAGGVVLLCFSEKPPAGRFFVKGEELKEVTNG